MTEIPEHLRKRAEAVRVKAEGVQLTVPLEDVETSNPEPLSDSAKASISNKVVDKSIELAMDQIDKTLNRFRRAFIFNIFAGQLIFIVGLSILFGLMGFVISACLVTFVNSIMFFTVFATIRTLRGKAVEELG